MYRSLGRQFRSRPTPAKSALAQFGPEPIPATPEKLAGVLVTTRQKKRPRYFTRESRDLVGSNSRFRSVIPELSDVSR